MSIDITTIMKIFGGLATVLSGLTAIGVETKSNGKLTWKGYVILSALIGGGAASAISNYLEYRDKDREKVINDNLMSRIQTYSANNVYTTKDANLFASFSVDKNSIFLGKLINKLDKEIEYARKNCKPKGSVVPCKDYIFRSVIIDEIRFTTSSDIFKSSDPAERGLIKYSGMLIEFFKEKLSDNNTNPIDEYIDDDKKLYGKIGGMIFAPWSLPKLSTFEYDGTNFRWLISGKLPDEVMPTARILSVMEVVGKGVELIPVFSADDYCVDKDENKRAQCYILVNSFRKTIKMEASTISFPHRRNINLLQNMKTAKSKFGFVYKYKNFPDDIEKFQSVDD